MVEPRFYNQTEVGRLVGRSRWTINRWVETGEFPAPIRLPEGRPAWERKVVDEWLTRRTGSADPMKQAA